MLSVTKDGQCSSQLLLVPISFSYHYVNFSCRVNPKKLTSIKPKLDAFCAQDQELKHWAQKVCKQGYCMTKRLGCAWIRGINTNIFPFLFFQTVVSYVRSVFLQSNKKIFDAHKLPVDEFAL